MTTGNVMSEQELLETAQRLFGEADKERLLLIGTITSDAYWYLKLENMLCQFRQMALNGDANAKEFCLGFERFANLCKVIRQ